MGRISSARPKCCASLVRNVGGMAAISWSVSFETVAAMAKVIDWLDELTAECPKKIAHNMNDPCGARCRDLARVL